MARNGSGVYTKVNTFAATNPITASGHNQNWDDIATEITNSVAADGQTNMTGPLKASSGSLSNPSQTFAADTNTGRYRKASDTMADVCGGAEVVEYSSTGINVTGTVKQSGFALLPVGLGPLPWSGTAAPAGWLLCYGQSLSRSTYAALWSHAQTEIGLGNALFTNGDGSTTFTVADMRGRVPAGADAMGGNAANRLTDAVSGIDTLGDAGGAQSKTLLTANLPPYTPAGTNSGGAATISTTSNSFQGGGTNAVNAVTAGASISATFTNPTFTGAAQGGTSTPFSIVQPTLVTNYIIFAGV